MSTSVEMSSPMTTRERSSANAVMGSGQVGNLERRLSRTRFHRNGERTPPCGQPDKALMERELAANERIVWRELMSAVIQLVIVHPTPALIRASWMDLNEIRSNAPSMSRKTPRA